MIALARPEARAARLRPLHYEIMDAADAIASTGVEPTDARIAARFRLTVEATATIRRLLEARGLWSRPADYGLAAVPTPDPEPAPLPKARPPLRRRGIPGPPLPPDRAELAASEVAYARALARRHAQATPHLAEEIESVALLGLTLAARDFDPARGVTFRTYAAPRIVGAIKDCRRDSALKGFRRRPAEAPGVASLEAGADDESPFRSVLANDEEPPEAGAIYHDDLAGYFRGLPTLHGRVMRLLYGRAGTLTMKAAGRELGYSECYISIVHAEAIAMIRSRLGVREEAS